VSSRVTGKTIDDVTGSLYRMLCDQSSVVNLLSLTFISAINKHVRTFLS